MKALFSSEVNGTEILQAYLSASIKERLRVFGGEEDKKSPLSDEDNLKQLCAEKP